MALTEPTRRFSIFRYRLKIIAVAGGSVGVPLLIATLYLFTDLFFTPPAHVASRPESGDWAMFGRDLAHTGAVELPAPEPRGSGAGSSTAPVCARSRPNMAQSPDSGRDATCAGGVKNRSVNRYRVAMRSGTPTEPPATAIIFKRYRKILNRRVGSVKATLTYRTRSPSSPSR